MDPIIVKRFFLTKISIRKADQRFKVDFSSLLRTLVKEKSDTALDMANVYPVTSPSHFTSNDDLISCFPSVFEKILRS